MPHAEHMPALVWISGSGPNTQYPVPAGHCDCDCNKACPPYRQIESFQYPTTWDEIPTVRIDWCHSVAIIPHLDRVVALTPQVMEQFSPARLGSAIEKVLASPLPSSCTPDGRALDVWLHLTDDCNLRCTYCYVPKRPQAMSQEVAQRAVEATVRSALQHEFDTLHLKYAGGEPLLNIATLLSAHDYAAGQASQYGLRLKPVVLTNGTLLSDQCIAELEQRDISISISLDGLGAVQDGQRKCVDGSDSFALVEKSLERLEHLGVQPHISITVTAYSVKFLPALFDYLLRRNLSFSLNFYREHGRSGEQSHLSITERAIPHILAALEVVEQHLSPQSLIGVLADRADFRFTHLFACSAGHSYLVIDPNGQVFKCQMDMSHSVSSIDAHDPLKAVRNSLDGIQNLPAGKRTECAGCRWRFWCGGGCPYLTNHIKGQFGTSSPHCDIYQAVFPAVLRLEGLRLLKYCDPVGLS